MDDINVFFTVNSGISAFIDGNSNLVRITLNPNNLNTDKLEFTM